MPIHRTPHPRSAVPRWLLCRCVRCGRGWGLSGLSRFLRRVCVCVCVAAHKQWKAGSGGFDSMHAPQACGSSSRWVDTVQYSAGTETFPGGLCVATLLFLFLSPGLHVVQAGCVGCVSTYSRCAWNCNWGKLAGDRRDRYTTSSDVTSVADVHRLDKH